MILPSKELLNKGLNIEILDEIGSRWQHKDGGVYTIYSTIAYSYEEDYNICKKEIPCIWYKDQQDKIHVDTKEDFLDSFKPYEPVYEYQWAIKDKYGKATISPYMTNEEANIVYRGLLPTNRICLDFTKREIKNDISK